MHISGFSRVTRILQQATNNTVNNDDDDNNRLTAYIRDNSGDLVPELSETLTQYTTFINNKRSK